MQAQRKPSSLMFEKEILELALLCNYKIRRYNTQWAFVPVRVIAFASVCALESRSESQDLKFARSRLLNHGDKSIITINDASFFVRTSQVRTVKLGLTTNLA